MVYRLLLLQNFIKDEVLEKEKSSLFSFLKNHAITEYQKEGVIFLNS